MVHQWLEFHVTWKSVKSCSPPIIGDGIGEVTNDATTDSVLDASQLSWSLLNDKH